MRKAWIICLLIPLSVGGLAAWLTMGSMEQFASLAQPPLSPPGWVFPVAWTVLYLLMGAASCLIWHSDALQPEKKGALTWYALQLAVNFVWPLLFFGAGGIWHCTALAFAADHTGAHDHCSLWAYQQNRRVAAGAISSLASVCSLPECRRVGAQPVKGK